MDINPNSSVNNSQDDSDDSTHMPLPPIKQISCYPKGDPTLHIPKIHHDKHNTLKNENSHQSLGDKMMKTKKKLNENLKTDKAKIFKKTFVDVAKGGKKKRYLGA